MSKLFLISAAFLGSCLLSACDGGGSSSLIPPPPLPLELTSIPLPSETFLWQEAWVRKTT